MKIYLTKFYITQIMFCIASCRPSLIRQIIATLDHALMRTRQVTARKTNAFNRL